MYIAVVIESGDFSAVVKTTESLTDRGSPQKVSSLTAAITMIATFHCKGVNIKFLQFLQFVETNGLFTKEPRPLKALFFQLHLIFL